MENNVPDNSQGNYYGSSQGNYDPGNGQGYQGNYTPANGQGYEGNYTPVNGQGYQGNYTPVNGQGYQGNNYGNYGQGNNVPWTPQGSYVPPNGQSSFIVDEKRENVLMGVIGAFIFALAGGVVWFLLDLVHFVAGISGFVAVYCAIQGYKKFGGRLSKKGVIISTVIAMLVLVLAWYLCFVKDLYEALKEINAVTPYMPSFSDCFKNGFELLKDSDVASGYWGSLAIGLGLAALGAFGTVRQAFKEGK